MLFIWDMAEKLKDISPDYFPLYIKTLLEAVDLPEESGLSFGEKKFHINRLGPTHYGDVGMRNGGIISDEARFRLPNGIDVDIRRLFKAPQPKQKYFYLLKSASYGEVSGEIMHYTVSMQNLSLIPENTRAQICKHIEKITSDGRGRALGQVVLRTGSVMMVNSFMQDVQKLDGALHLSLSREDPRLQNMNEKERAEIPWIRRKDKKFSPETIVDSNHIYVCSETRTYVYFNLVGIRLRKVFNEPLLKSEYKDYKTRRRKTLEENAAPPTLDLFPKSGLKNLLNCVG